MSYDGLDRLDTASGFWGSGSFDYDVLGNITQKTLGNDTLTYHYSNNRLTSVSGTLNRSFSYDTRGNVINNGARSFTFNRAGRLASSGSISYLYDGHGRRIMKNNNGSKTYSLYSQQGRLISTIHNGTVTDYIYLGSQMVARHSNNQPNDNQPGYTGHLEDDDLQLTYMQQRYYDPVIGRFYSNDPVDMLGHMQRGNPAMGFNRYAYANNNPYKYVDPNGEFGIIGALIGGGIDAAIQIGNNMKNGQGFGDAVMNIDLGSVAVSAALGSVTGGATTLLKGAATGTTKVAGSTVQLTSRTERAVVGTLGANKAAAVGFIQAERRGNDGMQGAAAQVVNGVTSPIPVGTIVMEGAAMLTSSDEQKTPPPEVDRERQ